MRPYRRVPANCFILQVMKDDEQQAPKRPKLTTRDILILIFRAYRDTFPYVLIFVLLLTVGTWILTEVVFR